MPKSTSTPEIIDLTIESLSHGGGRGVGRYQGVVVFVPGTAPQDHARVRITHKKSRFWEGELVELVKASPHRRAPPCPVADRCGGCSWQHVNYPEQIVQKEKILKDALRPLARLQQWLELPFLAAAEEFHYRNRIQVQIQDGKKGFFGKRSHDLVEVDECWIAKPEINRQLRALNAVGPRVELRSDQGSSFAQVNEAQNQILRQRVVELIDFQPDWILDLYSGSGNLTLPIAEKFPYTPMTAIELNPAAVTAARATHTKIEWLAGDVGMILSTIKPKSGTGLIVLDPPRQGADARVLKQLMRLRPAKILYVSCNPATFARDGLGLKENYRLELVQGLDMFPQTEHVELLAVLSLATAPKDATVKA